MASNTKIYNSRCLDYNIIAANVNMKRQTVRNISLKYKQTGEIFESKRERKTKLSSQQLDFILNLINDKENIGINLIDIKYRLSNSEIQVEKIFTLNFCCLQITQKK